MKYKKIVFLNIDVENISIITTDDDVAFTSFPAEVGNPNYDAFLIQANLTDKKVQALTPDKWYDFPTEETN